MKSLSVNDVFFCFSLKAAWGKKECLPKSLTDVELIMIKEINSYIKLGKKISIEECVSKLETDLLVVVDEARYNSLQFSQASAKVILNLVDKYSFSELKHGCLTLQGDVWKSWSKLVKQEHNSVLSAMQKAEIHSKMCNLREQQYEMTKQQPHQELMDTFSKTLLSLVSENVETALHYLQWIKLHFDKKKNTDLPELTVSYTKAIEKLNKERIKDIPDDAIMKEIGTLVTTAENNLLEAFCGVAHFMREIGQLYECIIENDKISNDSKASYEAYPKAAAKLLLGGYSLELMDGDAGNVPLTWLQSIFKHMKQLIGDKKLFVLAILGVQSSGKSTFLNTMFGLNFSVNVGRCSRGIFMHLIPVLSGSSYKFDYVLVLDTEGLRAPESGQSKCDYDNQIATLVIGLADLTIINVKGENTTEVRDILQISVHAFLRMSIVNARLKLKQACMFIHQNVPAVNAKEKMQHGHHKLQDNLDEMTKEAAKLVGFHNIHSFSQVIRHSGQDNVCYFSDLWEGDPPMGPTNPGYSRNVFKVKRWILDNVADKKQSFYTFSDMALRIEDLWNGIITHDFIFNFRNCLEIKSYRDLEEKFCLLLFELERYSSEWLTKDAKIELTRARIKKNCQMYL